MRSKPTYWDRVRKEIRPKFAAAGLLNICELHWPQCIGAKLRLTFAHSLRRRKIDKFKNDGNEAMYELKMRRVIRACVKCHEQLDSLEHDETERIVEETIKNRKKPVV